MASLGACGTESFHSFYECDGILYKHPEPPENMKCLIRMFKVKYLHRRFEHLNNCKVSFSINWVFEEIGIFFFRIKCRYDHFLLLLYVIEVDVLFVCFNASLSCVQPVSLD